MSSGIAGALAARARKLLQTLVATRHSLGARLLIGVLLFSMFVTFILTAIQLYIDYQRNVAALAEQLDLIDESYVGSLAESLWTLDETQLRLQLAGIVQLAGIRAAEVREADTATTPLVVKIGESPKPPIVTRDYPLFHTVQGRDQFVGTLHVEATLADANRRLEDTAWRVFAIQAAEIFLVSLFIVYFFHYLVTRHLSAIAAEVGSYRINDSPLALRLKGHRPRHEDELDRVTTAFNGLSQNLHAAYRELADREARIRRLVDANIIGVFTWQLVGKTSEDRDAVFRDVNDAFLRIVGYDREDLATGSVRLRMLTPPDWQDRTERARAEMKLNRAVQPYEKEYIRKDGSRVPVLIGSAQFDETGEQGVAFVLDLSEQKKTEKRLHDMQAALTHVTRITTLGELTASIAHELNQPLAAIITNGGVCLRLLERDSPDMQQVHDALEDIVSDGVRAGEIIKRLRALSQRAELTKELLDLNEVIREIIPLLRRELTAHDVFLDLELTPGLAPVFGDKVELQQVILNLVMNGMDAIMSAAGGPRRLLISTSNEADNVVVAIQDTGVGLALDVEDRLFDSFFTTKPSGMGMGLAICRSVIELHGGRIWASRNPFRGATFQFSLPAQEKKTSA